MRKIYLTLLAAVAVFTAYAQANITTSWANLFEAGPRTHGCDMVIDDDNIYYLLSAGTTQGSGDSGWPKEYTDPTLSIYYGGQKICTGAPYEGSSENSNLNIIKTDLQGNFKWVVYSTSGEVSGNDGCVAVAPDGGIYVATKIRHTQNMPQNDIVITDAAGNNTTLEWQIETSDDGRDRRYWRGLLLKISANGELQWLRTIDLSTAPQPNATGNQVFGTFDAISLSDIISDSDGKFYVTGRYSNPMSLYRADGSALTLIPHNTEGWSGDPQDTRGDIFIAKYDGNGHVITTFTTQGNNCAELMSEMAWKGNDIVMSCFVKGNGTNNYVAVGNDTYSTPDDNQNLLIIALNKQLQPLWSKFYMASNTNKGKMSVMQWNDLQVAGNSIIINGMGNFTLDNGKGGSFATQNASREGFVIKLNANDGSWLAGTTSMAAFPTINPRGTQYPNTGINGWVGCFEAQNDSLYVYGYNMAQHTVYLASLESDNLTPGTLYHLIKGGNSPSAFTCKATGNRLYTMSNGRVFEDYDDDGEACGYLGNFEYINSDITTTPIPKNEAGYFSSYCVALAAFDLPFEVMEWNDTIAGDVNGDGFVTAADVTALYDYLLNNDTSSIVNGDQNNDGDITASDVTAVYNILLGDTNN